ncbi:Phenylacetic acid degradation-related domain-containing protein [Desulfonema limicola]|uniref:Medium/long-chain acyl-CoA thioesterase YigI n=1 Tax=Desulfonema limicola TaxID=45656 RepID=A0A975B6T3_9BACT|nr:thioesterase family protein [Desulfonema limicola]QTA79851.1 Phenylacetic acid degradation-related domain-containing protein [Desulfonema limicola]
MTQEKELELKDLLNILKDIYQNQMPFNRLLNIRVEKITPEEVRVRIDMREELIGNFIRKSLHGGVISSILDLTGGLIASAEMIKRMQGISMDEIGASLAKIGTIDLRIDYLRAGRGRYFTASGNILRTGNKVAVIRMEFHNDENLLIAAGTGTYLVG